MATKKTTKPADFNKNPKLGDVEKMAIAITRKLSFEESGAKDTPQNRKDWDDIVKDFTEMEADGIVMEIPSS